MIVLISSVQTNQEMLHQRKERDQWASLEVHQELMERVHLHSIEVHPELMERVHPHSLEAHQDPKHQRMRAKGSVEHQDQSLLRHQTLGSLEVISQGKQGRKRKLKILVQQRDLQSQLKAQAALDLGSETAMLQEEV
jgi:hypothetical protein